MIYWQFLLFFIWFFVFTLPIFISYSFLANFFSFCGNRSHLYIIEITIGVQGKTLCCTQRLTLTKRAIWVLIGNRRYYRHSFKLFSWNPIKFRAKILYRNLGEHTTIKGAIYHTSPRLIWHFEKHSSHRYGQKWTKKIWAEVDQVDAHDHPWCTP